MLADQHLTTGSLASTLNADLDGPAHIPIRGVATIDRAAEGELTFIRSPKFARRWPASGASAAVVSRRVSVPGHDATRRALLLVDDADHAMIRLLPEFLPRRPAPAPGVDPSAEVDPSATIARDAHVGPLCVIAAGAVVGAGSVLVAQVYLGTEASIGAGSVLHPGVRVLDRCVVGSRCELWPNVVIGADGFGYLPAPDGRGLLKVPHVGNVVLGDGVEIGANSAVDRGKFGSTTVGDGTKIDNHCQIGHNCSIGRSVVIAGMAGIAGSVTIEDGAVIAGHVGIADHLTIGARAVIAAKSGVIADVPPGATVFGTPAGPHREQMRSLALLRRLPEYVRRLEELEKAMGASHHAPERT